MGLKGVESKDRSVFTYFGFAVQSDMRKGLGESESRLLYDVREAKELKNQDVIIQRLLL